MLTFTQIHRSTITNMNSEQELSIWGLDLFGGENFKNFEDNRIIEYYGDNNIDDSSDFDGTITEM